MTVKTQHNTTQVFDEILPKLANDMDNAVLPAFLVVVFFVCRLFI